MNISPQTDTVPYAKAFEGKIVPLKAGDSIMEKALPVKSLFRTQQIENKKPIPRNITGHLQPFWFLAVSLLIVAIINAVYYKWLRSEFTGFFKLSPKISANQEKESRKGTIFIFIYLVYYINLAVFLWHFIHINNYPFILFKTPTTTFFVMALLIILFSLFKKLLIIILTVIFTEAARISQLLQIENQTIIVLSSLLLGFNFLFIYALPSPAMSFIILIIIMLIHIIRIIKLFINIRLNTSFLNYQIILYLCSLEILPLTVLVKYLIVYGI